MMKAPPSYPTQLSYDLVIVGAGPSACGLLYGLVRRHIDNVKCGNDSDNDSGRCTRPSKQPLPYTIAVLDRGGKSSSSSSSRNSSHQRRPQDWFKASHYSGANQQIHTVPQCHGLGGRIVTVPIGSGLGGTTNINACLVSAPAKTDFDVWPKQWRGNVMTHAAHHLAGIMRENHALEETEFGICTDDTVSSSLSSLSPAEFPSFVSKVATSTSTKKLGPTGKHERVNYYDGLLRPLLDKYPYLRENITFLEGFNAQRITFDDVGCATGVVCNVFAAGDQINIKARRQVVLCTGAILSPALLMVSGIGPLHVLSKQGITPLSSSMKKKSPPTGWDNVGQDLTDHVILPRAFLTLPDSGPTSQWSNKSISGIQCWYNKCISWDQGGKKEEGAATTAANLLYQLALTDGLCSKQLIPHFVAAWFRRGSKSKTRISRLVGCSISAVVFHTIRWILSFLMAWTPLGLVVRHCTATINICLLNPFSKGHVSINRKRNRNNKCSAHAGLDDFNILVDPKYLSDIRDMAAMKQGWNLSNDIRAKYFASCWEVLPSAMYRLVLPWLLRILRINQGGEKEWIFQYAADFACPYFHWNGTCSMGDETAVGDETTYVANSRLEVTGVKRLRVCDASVFSSNVSCPPALTCACLGYVASEFINDDIAKEM